MGTRPSKRTHCAPYLFMTLIGILVLLSVEVCMAKEDDYRLPRPLGDQDACLSRILQARRTIRSFAPRPLSQMKVAQLLWAAQGVTSPEGYRTAPSAGALYPLELHLVAGNVEGLPSGSYRYDPARHLLQATVHGDLRQRLAESALNQHWVAEAPAILVISATETRTTSKYGRRGVRYVHMEVGHASQNLLLQAADLGLGGAIVGAFNDERLQHLLQLPEEERPLAILPVGHPVGEASPGQ
jgi:SagB-type dehydrogenase family enzyme